MDFSAQRLKNLSGPILITGHTGFKGTWMTLLLEKLGVRVIGYSLKPEFGSLFDRAERTGAIPETFDDVRNYDAVSRFIDTHRPSAVIHMAAQPLVLESYRTPRATFETNVLGTANVLDASFSCGSVEAVVVVTTDKVYRNDNTGRAFVETDPLAGKDPYSASKVGTEAVVAAWQQIAKVSGGPKIVSVRAGNVIGGGDWADNRLLPDLVKSFISREPLSVRNPSSTRPWQHVLDPLSGYLLSLVAILDEKDILAVNFGPKSRSLSVAEVVSVAQDHWPMDSHIDLLGTNQQSFVEAESLQLDAQFAQTSLAWTSLWTQEEAVASTVMWWDKVMNRSIDPVTACLDDIAHLLDK